MSSKPSRKEIAKSIKTLLVLLQSMRGKYIVIYLRDDCMVEGIVERVDGFMNVELSQAMRKKDTFYDVETTADNSAAVEQHDYLFVKGPKIRHIQLPEELDDMQHMVDEIKKIRNRRIQWSKRDIVSGKTGPREPRDAGEYEDIAPRPRG